MNAGSSRILRDKRMRCIATDCYSSLLLLAMLLLLLLSSAVA